MRHAVWKAVGIGLTAVVLTNLTTLLFDDIGLNQPVADRPAISLHGISISMRDFASYRALYGYTTSIDETKSV